jgi:hypothetical protein
LDDATSDLLPNARGIAGVRLEGVFFDRPNLLGIKENYLSGLIGSDRGGFKL